jgi:hypothetical protein
MAKERRLTQITHGMRATIKRIRDMVEEKSIGQMEQFMKVTTWRTSIMVMAREP